MVNVFTTLVGIGTRTLHIFTVYLPLLLWAIWLQTYDFLIFAVSFLIPNRRKGKVIATGHPGHQGNWPKYIPPVQGLDSRSPCPGLNTLANHDILPHDGKRITYKQLSSAIQHAYNLAPTLADQLTASAAVLDQGRGWINLYDLNALGIVQHDASFTRPDIAFCPDQSYPHSSMVDHFLDHASNGKNFTVTDYAYYSGLVRAKCKRTNGQYSLTWSFLHKFLGSGSAALMYGVFGGIVDDLRIWLTEERLPDGWEPKSRAPLGWTITQAQAISLAVEFNINEQQKLAPKDEAYLQSNEGQLLDL